MTASSRKLPSYKVVALSELVPYALNSRTHPEWQIDKVAASIREFGFTTPILTDGANGIVAGHCRVLAARKVGLTVVPVIELAHLTETQRKAYVIADNRLALDGGWDTETLKLEFDALDEAGFDLELTGFTLDEVAAFGAADLEPIGGDGDTNGTGSPKVLLKFGRREIPLSAEELARLEDAYAQYVDAYGGEAGFATWLLAGNADA